MTTTPLKCRLDPIADINQVEKRWRALESGVDASYFLSWSWIGTWLRRLPATLDPRLLCVSDENGDLGLAIVIDRLIFRHRVFRSRAMFINKTGDDAIDQISIEYNGMLVAAEWRKDVTKAALDFLFSQQWDEVFIDSVAHRDFFNPAETSDWTMRCRRASKGYGVDLSAIRAAGSSYLESLSRNTRAQIRRAKRNYEKAGPLTVEAAPDVETALRWFERLVDMHQRYWVTKGQPGAFANDFLHGFHCELIEQHLPKGEIQMLRVGFGERWIGYLYNFLHRGRVLNYQTGFDYAALPDRNRPGVIAHYAAIEYHLAAGAGYYDFLRGENQNKVTLSTEQTEFEDFVGRRRCTKFLVEDCLRAAKAWIDSRIAMRA